MPTVLSRQLQSRTRAGHWQETALWGAKDPVLGGLSASLTLPDYGRVARNPSRIDVKRGDPSYKPTWSAQGRRSPADPCHTIRAYEAVHGGPSWLR